MHTMAASREVTVRLRSPSVYLTIDERIYFLSSISNNRQKKISDSLLQLQRKEIKEYE